jgi:hypothetical protein
MATNIHNDDLKTSSNFVSVNGGHLTQHIFSYYYFMGISKKRKNFALAGI